MVEYLDHHNMESSTDGGSHDDLLVSREAIEGFLTEKFNFDTDQTKRVDAVNNLFRRAPDSSTVNMVVFTAWYYNHIRVPYHHELSIRDEKTRGGSVFLFELVFVIIAARHNLTNQPCFSMAARYSPTN